MSEKELNDWFESLDYNHKCCAIYFLCDACSYKSAEELLKDLSPQEILRQANVGFEEWYNPVTTIEEKQESYEVFYGD